MNAIVDRGFEQQAVECQPGRPSPVHGCTSTLGQQACTFQY